MIPSAPQLATMKQLPNVWGEGAIFAFSGMDGPAEPATGFVSTFGREPFDLVIHTPVRRHVKLRAAGPVRVATNDVLQVGPLTVTFADWHTIIGAGVLPILTAEPGTPTDAVAVRHHGDRFAVAYGTTEAEAVQRAAAGLTADLRAEVEKRLAVLPATDRLLAKCFSVMRVNTLSADAAFRTRWSTPDRVPHQHCWLWDSVFHSLAMNHFDARLAGEFLAAMLDAQRPDGMIPITKMVTGGDRIKGMTQPPLLAWGVWENYRFSGDKAFLAAALPRLEAYLEWDLRHRDRNGNGLLEWDIEGKSLCRSGESGLDNSSRFDEALHIDAVDFSVFAAHDMLHVAKIARELGHIAPAATWEQKACAMTTAIHARLWNEADGLYYDAHLDGRLSPVKAVSGFLPLLLDDLPSGRATRLAAMLNDPRHFATAFPVPSLAISEPTWSTDMWRGATWLNFNYLIILGLRRHGLVAEAAQLKERTLHHVRKYYEQAGVIFEFFDAKDERPPWLCDRKGPNRGEYDFRVKYDSIRDYHWSAAITACLLLEQE